MAPHTINTTVAGRQLGKKIICWTPANISSLITSATNNNARVQMFAAQFPKDSCGCQVPEVRPPDCRLAPRHARHLLQSLLAGDDRDQWLRQQVIQHRLFWWVGQGLIIDMHQPLLANSFRKLREFQSFSAITPLKQFCPLAWFQRSKCWWWW